MEITDQQIDAKIFVKFDTDKNATKSMEKFNEEFPDLKTKKRWDREFTIILPDTTSDTVKVKSGELFSYLEDYIGFKFIDVTIEEDYSISKNKK